MVSVSDTLKSIRIGDKVVINDWKAKYTVCGLSEHYVLAHYGQHYTIISRVPVDDTHGRFHEGDYKCGADWWVFGHPLGYDFTSKNWAREYMTSLESGETEISQKKCEPVWFLSVVSHTNTVYRKEKTPEGA